MSWRCCADGPPSMHLCKVLIKFHLFDITASQTSPHLCAQGPAPYKAQGCPFNLRKCNQSSQISWKKKFDFRQWVGDSAVPASGRSVYPSPCRLPASALDV